MEEFRLKILSVGVGGGGCNTIKRLIKIGIRTTDFVAINTDRTHLGTMPREAKKVLIGASITRGLGAGGFADVAEKCAEADCDEIKKAIGSANLVFLCAGMGGGTGTGASPVVARIAKEEGAVVIGFVTFPFKIERSRIGKAIEGIDKLRQVCDTLIVIDNNKLLEFVPNLPIEEAFMVADEITARAIRGISDTLQLPSLLNLDFADLKTVMQKGGIGLIAVGEGKGASKVDDCVRSVFGHKLLDVSPENARGSLIHITGGKELTIGEVTKI
jgi:cell division protein FtsZ